MMNVGLASSTASPVSWHYSSHQGSRNRYNEDAYGCWPEQQFFAVCDGMGGHGQGHQASRLTIAMLDQYIRMHPMCSIDQLTQHVQDINRVLLTLSYQQQLPKPMGSTLSLIGLSAHMANILHIGDSRIYRWRDYCLTCLTRDDCPDQVNDLARAMTGSQASPYLTQALGLNRRFALRQYKGVHRAGDDYLLLTDGITDVLQDYEIANVLERTTRPGEAVDLLLDQADSKGGTDDKTALLIKS